MSLTPSEHASLLDNARSEAALQTAECAKTAVDYHIDQAKKQFKKRATIGVVAITGALLIVGTAWSQLRTRHTPPARLRATAKCVDGTWSYAYNRQGACAGHGGVKVFYK